MTLLEFLGCTLITFGPPLAMFIQSVSHDPIKIILFIASTFFWLLSFLTASIFWYILSKFCDYLIIGAYIAVISQELFRYLFNIATRKAEIILENIISNSADTTSNTDRNTYVTGNSSTTEIQLATSGLIKDSKIQFSYISGIGFGFMNAACLMSNMLADFSGPGTMGLKGDSQYFLLTSSFTNLAFVLMNVSWSVITAKSLENSDRKLLIFVIVSHLLATTATFANHMQMQILSLIVVYATALICGCMALKVNGINPCRRQI